MKNFLKTWGARFLTVIAALIGGGVAGRMSAPVQKDTVDVVFPTSYLAKPGKLNTISVETKLPFKFFTDSKDSWRACGKDFIFAGTSPMTVWVVTIKDNELQDPVSCSVTLDGPPTPPIPPPVPPDPKPPVPPPDPKPPVPPPVPPADLIAKAIQTAWQQEFMPNKQTYLPKMIQLFQAMYDKVDSATTYGDVSKVMTDKSKELALIGVCPVLSAAINNELGNVFPRSPSVLIDKTLAKDTLSKVIAALKTLT